MCKLLGLIYDSKHMTVYLPLDEMKKTLKIINDEKRNTYSTQMSK